MEEGIVQREQKQNTTVMESLSGAHFSGWHPSSTSSSSSQNIFVIGIYNITTLFFFPLLLSLTTTNNYFFSSICLVHWKFEQTVVIFLWNLTPFESLLRIVAHTHTSFMLLIFFDLYLGWFWSYTWKIKTSKHLLE